MNVHSLEKIYLKSPLALQNILVSTYGLREQRIRYGGIYKTHHNWLLKTQWLPKDELNKIESNLLSQTLQNALVNVPFYKDLTIKKEASLEDFPTILKKRFFDEPNAFLSKKFANKKLLTLHTSGSTGTPLAIKMNKDTRRKSYAFMSRFYNTIGFKAGEKKATFVGRRVQLPDNNKPPFWRYNLFDNQLLFSSYHTSKKNLCHYLKKLDRFKPKLIEGYSSSILRIARHILEHSVNLNHVPNSIAVSSETLTKKQRDEIESAFGCKVYNQYGSSETALFASDCEHQKMHISQEHGIIEVLQKNKLNRKGEGELIVTGFINPVTPFIRYAIGDRGSISYKKCKCGRQSPIIEKVEGKINDIIVTPDGNHVPSAGLILAFEYLNSIKESQVVQDKKDEVCVNIVPKLNYNKKEEKFMLWELRKRLGSKMKIHIQKVKEIKVSSNGKYKFIVQNYLKKK